MLAVMIAPTLGINALSPAFFVPLLFTIALTSFGIAGVGGGATYAAILVLSSMGLPIELAGLLVSIEPLIDMARTALNVSDSVVTGLVTARMTKNVDMKIYNNKNIETEAMEI
jgi:L-cystine uptake protein TcyP (sodium:dicarboxylate symporter family)